MAVVTWWAVVEDFTFFECAITWSPLRFYGTNSNSNSKEFQFFTWKWQVQHRSVSLELSWRVLISTCLALMSNAVSEKSRDRTRTNRVDWSDSLETVWVVASTYLDPSTLLNDTTQSPARDSTLTNQQTTIFYKNSTATPYRPPETQTVTWLSQTVHPKRWKQFPPFSRKLGVDVLVKKMETFWCGR